MTCHHSNLTERRSRLCLINASRFMMTHLLHINCIIFVPLIMFQYRNRSLHQVYLIYYSVLVLTIIIVPITLGYQITKTFKFRSTSTYR